MFNEIEFNEARKIDRAEATVSKLIRTIKHSRYARDCFADARQLVGQGYPRSMALLHSWRFWGS